MSKYAYNQTVSVNTLVNPPYPPYLSEYTNLRNKVVITLNNNQNNTKQVYLKARFYNNNGFVAQTVADYKPLNPIDDVYARLSNPDLPARQAAECIDFGQADAFFHLAAAKDDRISRLKAFFTGRCLRKVYLVLDRKPHFPNGGLLISPTKIFPIAPLRAVF